MLVLRAFWLHYLPLLSSMNQQVGSMPLRYALRFLGSVSPRDSIALSQAYQLLLTLSELAKRNRTIILSLHQPRSDAFSLFTRLLLLSKGSVVYSGLTSKCLPWFSSLGFSPEKGVNPLDFLIDISSIDNGDDEKRELGRARVERLTTAWKNDGAAYSIEKSQRWSRRLLNDLVNKEKTTEDFADKTLRRFLNPTAAGDPALRRASLLSQTITLTSR